MGTQFSSRLSDKDAREILELIAAAFSKRLVDKAAKRWIDSALKEPTEGKKAARAARPSLPPKSVTSLTAPQERVLGDATVGGVLAVAESHDFFACFASSTLFTGFLEWLFKLRNDAAFNGFNKTVQKYDLEKSQNPLSEVIDRLADLADTLDKDGKDPLRGAAVDAAKTVLAEVAAANPPKRPGESQSRQLGRQFEMLNIKDIATKYVAVYIKGVVKPMLQKAGQDKVGGITEEAIRLADKTAERIARKVLGGAEKAGLINKPKEIREIVIEELKQLQAPIPEPTGR